MRNLSSKIIEEKIFLIRGQKVMLSHHLAELYRVRTKALVQAVKRNRARFPSDFMFQLKWNEIKYSRSQIVTLKQGKNLKYLPHAFTEQGIAMLSSVLRSKKAVQVNIVIMRAFVKLREVLGQNRELMHKLTQLEHKIGQHDIEIRSIFEAIRKIMAVEEKPKRRIGFIT